MRSRSGQRDPQDRSDGPTPFGLGLRLARKAAGLRCDELATLADVSVEVVRAAELGVMPDTLSLGRIAAVLSHSPLGRSRS